MGFDNIADANGLGLALIGITVVFAGLVLVAAMVALLPRLLDRTGGRGSLRAPRIRGADAAVMERERSLLGLDPDLLAAIGYVMQAERERQLAMDDDRITLRDDQEQRVWTAIGKMRTLSRRL